MENNTGIQISSKVIVEKGCKALGITKGSTAYVKNIVELGPDYSHSVRVSLFFLNSFAAGKTFNLIARHINRLSDIFVNLNDGNPTHKITVVLR
jgi:hypothetical protein